jgi:hypothetical protein
MTDDFAGLPTYDVLAAHEPESGRKPATWWVVGGVVALVAALIGGITYGAASLSGGGAQPEDALPAGAVAFAKVDLDPAASQKVDAIRFLRKFPSLRNHLTADADLRKVLFEAVADDAGWKKVDFAKDVEPWLGDRVGVAAYSPKDFGHAKTAGGPSAPTVVVALQVGDEDKARAGLNRLIAATPGSKPGYVVQDGYALLAENTKLAQSVADGVQKGTLAKAKTFAADIGSLDDNIATFWIDGDAATSLASVANLYGVGLPGAAGAGASGAVGKKKNPALTGWRVVFSLRFDGPDVLELAGTIKHRTNISDPNVPLKGFANLPPSTVAAIGLGGGDSLVDHAWKNIGQGIDSSAGADSFDNAVRQAEALYGLKLPDDLKLLLGSNLLVALDSSGLGAGSVELGARVTTGNPKRANSLIGRLTKGLTGSEMGLPDITHQVTGDGYVVASSAAQADRMTKSASGSKHLGDLPAFRRALPDLDGARYALWVDLQGVITPLSGSDSADLKRIAGLGMTSTSDGTGGGSFRLRLVTN